MKSLPPRLLLRFFRWYCKPSLRNAIEGDLIEEYRERLKINGKWGATSKFAADVVLLFRPGIIRSMKIDFNLNTTAMYKSYFIVALRQMLKQKALNFLNVFGLSVGLAAGLIIAIHIRSELSYETSFEGYENIYRIHREGWATSTPVLSSEFSEFFPDVQEICRLSPFGTRVVNTANNNPGEAIGFYADSSAFDLFGLRVMEGDPRPLQTLNTVALTEHMAKRYFGETSPIGKIVTIDDERQFSVTAVIEDLPENTHLKFDYLVSMPTFYQDAGDHVDERRSWMIMYTYARLKPNGLNKISERMPQFIRKYYSQDRDVETKVASGAWRLLALKDIHLYSNLEKEMHPNSNALYIYLFGAIELMILLIASANFMSLFTTQSLRRMKEVGMRKIMGAKQRQIVNQFFTEASLMILVSAILAMCLFGLVIPFYNQLSGNTLTIWNALQRENLLTLGLLLLIVIAMTGLYPALFASSFRPTVILRSQKLPNSMPSLLRNGLVVFQFFVSVCLIAGALIVKQQMNLIRNKDLGFDKEQVISIKLYGDLWRQVFTAGDAFKNELLSNPNILAVGRVDRIIGERISIESVAAEGVDPKIVEPPGVRVLRVDEDLVDAMGIKVVEGRNFSDQFNDSAAFVINESAAKILQLQSPVDKVIANYSMGPDPRKGKVIGVVKDYHFASLHDEIEPLVMEYDPGSTDNLIVRLRAGRTTEALDYIENALKKLAPGNLFIYEFLDDRVNGLYRSEDVMGKIFQFFSMLAIVIACLGLFGLSSYTIERRTKEIGIRKVLGASVAGIAALLTSGIFRLILVGLVIAAPVTWYAMTRWLEKFAYKIEIQWWIFAVTAFIIMVVAMLAIGFRTIQAAMANPVNSLRNE